MSCSPAGEINTAQPASRVIPQKSLSRFFPAPPFKSGLHKFHFHIAAGFDYSPPAVLTGSKSNLKIYGR
jgi:hypothetical protein